MTKVRSRTTVVVDLFDAAQQYIGQRWRVGMATAMDEYRVSQAIEAACEALPRLPALPGRAYTPRALLVTVRSEQHNLGLHLVAMALSDDGWSVTVRTGIDATDIPQLPWRPSLVAISATYNSGNLRPQLRALVREVSLRNIPVIVGGSAFIRTPNLAAEIGTELVAPDARVGVILARKLRRRHGREISQRSSA